MSQAPTDPVRLTIQMLTELLEKQCPSRLPAFEEAKATLETGEASEQKRLDQLKQVIGTEVEISTERINGLDFYRWQGKTAPYQLEVPRPFEPNASRGLSAFRSPHQRWRRRRKRPRHPSRR